MRCIRTIFCMTPSGPSSSSPAPSPEPATTPVTTRGESRGLPGPGRRPPERSGHTAPDRGYNRAMNPNEIRPAPADRQDPDQYGLERFVTAQARQLDQVSAELQAGTKRSHWMWYVFPQLASLGRSDTAKHYGLRDLDEARAYLAHPVLGPRLLERSKQVLAIEGRSAYAIFGAVDALKFCSCMTLFAAADPRQPVFRECLEKYYDGEQDPHTLKDLT